MFVRLFLFLSSLSPAFEEWMWKRVYQKLAGSYKKQDWRFMNYGYAPVKNTPSIPLKNDEDENNRLFIQLYHNTLAGADVKGKNVLEVGSGRGGGAEYVARYLGPDSVVGVDFAKNAVDLCNQFYHQSNLSFVEGNAEKLPFPNTHFDVVFNVESSHCYGNMKEFVSEVYRVLKPGGIFAWTDLRPLKAMEEVDRIFVESPFKLLSKKNITPNILKALNLISDRKKEAIKERVSPFWQPLFSEFAGVRNSKIYRGFEEGRMVYFRYLFQKPD